MPAPSTDTPDLKARGCPWEKPGRPRGLVSLLRLPRLKFPRVSLSRGDALVVAAACVTLAMLGAFMWRTLPEATAPRFEAYPQAGKGLRVVCVNNTEGTWRVGAANDPALAPRADALLLLLDDEGAPLKGRWQPFGMQGAGPVWTVAPQESAAWDFTPDSPEDMAGARVVALNARGRELWSAPIP